MKRVFVFEYLTGCDARAAADELTLQGLAMRDAVAADLQRIAGCEVSVAAATGMPNAASASRPTPTTLRPRPGEAAPGFVAAQAARHDLTWVIAPETAGVLAQLQAAVPAPCWLGCSAAAIALASSKSATLGQLAGCGLPTPLNVDRVAAAQRWVVKPDDGAGSVDTRVHRHHRDALDDLAQRRRAGHSATLEPWIDGPAWSLSLLCGAAGAALLSVNRQRVRVDRCGGLTFEGVTANVLPAGDTCYLALQRLADRVVGAVPGLRGFVGIDFVWHPEAGPVLIEINPRVTSAYVGLSAALGRNLAAEVIASHAEEPSHADA
jgi:predicted ATP-grasp superfamily ATP-dependent carboligase